MYTPESLTVNLLKNQQYNYQSISQVLRVLSKRPTHHLTSLLHLPAHNHPVSLLWKRLPHCNRLKNRRHVHSLCQVHSWRPLHHVLLNRCSRLPWRNSDVRRARLRLVLTGADSLLRLHQRHCLHLGTCALICDVDCTGSLMLNWDDLWALLDDSDLMLLDSILRRDLIVSERDLISLRNGTNLIQI